MADEIIQIIEDRSVGIVEFRARPDGDALALDTLMESLSEEVDKRVLSAWVLDLTQVAYLNSAGLGMLCNLRFKIRQKQKKLALCGLSPRLLDLFKSCCLERLFVIVRTRQDAMQSLL